jgi:hypothetical protein
MFTEKTWNKLEEYDRFKNDGFMTMLNQNGFSGDIVAYILLEYLSDDDQDLEWLLGEPLKEIKKEMLLHDLSVFLQQCRDKYDAMLSSMDKEELFTAAKLIFGGEEE